MKILFINFLMPHFVTETGKITGGICTLQYNLSLGLKTIGHQVGFLVNKGTAPKKEVKTHFDFVESYEEKSTLPRTIRFLYQFVKMLNAIRNYNPDIIAQSGAGTITGLSSLIARILRKPFVYFVVSDWEADGRYSNKALFHEKIFFRYGFKNSSLVFVQNQYQKGRIENSIYKKRCKIIHVACGTILTEKNENTGEKYILWSGNFRPAKGMGLLFKIAQLIPDIKIKITGSQLYFEDNFNKLLSELFTLPNIERLGYLPRNELLSIFMNSSALLNTSQREGFPTTFIEAWSLGVPTVTFRYDPDNLITENNLGFVCKDELEVAEILKKIISGSIKIDKNSIIKYVKLNHSPTRLAREFIDEVGNFNERFDI